MMKIGCLVAIGVAVLLGLFAMGTYNGLVGAEQAVEAQWAQVENVYQRRADLVPNLVASVRGAANFERGTLTDVVEARSRVGQVFQDLMVQLEGTENRIATERRRFNEVAQGYNTRLKRFPTVLFASMMGFQPRPYFRSQPGAETAPKVDFSETPVTR